MSLDLAKKILRASLIESYKQARSPEFNAQVFNAARGMLKDSRITLKPPQPQLRKFSALDDLEDLEDRTDILEDAEELLGFVNFESWDKDS